MAPSRAHVGHPVGLVDRRDPRSRTGRRCAGWCGRWPARGRRRAFPALGGCRLNDMPPPKLTSGPAPWRRASPASTTCCRGEDEAARPVAGEPDAGAQKVEGQGLSRARSGRTDAGEGLGKSWMGNGAVEPPAVSAHGRGSAKDGIRSPGTVHRTSGGIAVARARAPGAAGSAGPAGRPPPRGGGRTRGTASEGEGDKRTSGTARRRTVERRDGGLRSLGRPRRTTP